VRDCFLEADTVRSQSAGPRRKRCVAMLRVRPTTASSRFKKNSWPCSRRMRSSMRSAICRNDDRLRQAPDRFRHPCGVLGLELNCAQGSAKAPPRATAPSPLAGARKCRISSALAEGQSFVSLEKAQAALFAAGGRERESPSLSPSYALRKRERSCPRRRAIPAQIRELWPSAPLVEAPMCHVS
jgi:hypothetical protein